MGTIFVCAEESPAHLNFKQMIVNAKDTDVTVTGRAGGAPIRSLKTKFTKRLLAMEKEGASFEEFEKAAVGSLRRGVQEGDMETGTFMAGQISGLIKEIAPAKEIVERLVKNTEDLLAHLMEKRGITIE